MRKIQPLPANGSTADLLSTKLALPRLRPSLVPREALFSLLDSGLEHAITLLCTPAGFGKTTLIRAWIAARNTDQERFKAAWLSLDADDNDPVRFWRYVIAACQRFDANIGQSALKWLNDTQPFHFDYVARFSFESQLIALINDLNELTKPCVLIIEDYHAITIPHIHETFAYFLDHLPTMVQVILLSRCDLPSQLVRLRAQGNVFELRASDLRFSLDETRIFLRQALPFPLTEETMERIYERTEGWAAGLNMLACALRRYTNLQEMGCFVETLTGRYRPLLEYLVSDVLNTQPEPLQTFLLQTCGLGRLTSSLCAAVTGRPDSDLLIEQIERANLFLEMQDGAGQWYRYHSLFAEAMQHEALHRLGVDEINSCFQRASHWYEQHNQLMDAIEMALKARDFTLAAILIERKCGTLLYRLETKEFYTLRRWFEQIPQAILQGLPMLYLIYICVRLFDPTGRIVTSVEQVSGIETLLSTIELQWRSEGNTELLGAIYTLRALLTVWQKNFKKASSFARQALVYLEEKEALWRGTCLSIVGAEEHHTGSLAVALRYNQEALELNRQAGENIYADRAIRLELGELYIKLGELHLADENYQIVLAEAEHDLFDRGKALLGLAQLAYERNMLDNAAEMAQEALELGQKLLDDEIQTRAELVLTKVQYARGYVKQAKQQLAELAARARGFLSQQLYREILCYQAQLDLKSRDLSAVESWIEQRSVDNNPLSLHLLIQEDLLVVRWLTTRGDLQEAQQLLEQCLSKAAQSGHTGSILEIQMLMACIDLQQDNVSKARHILQEVHSQAYAKGYQRLLLDEEETMIMPLHTLEDNQHKKVSRSALSRSRATETLSGQELRVLRLFIGGLSKPEIASELVVSTNTVKTHLRRIYHKLNVGSRAEARETAQRLHLL
jgi:LuxR family maltose regulon positive regulatory protein